MSMEFLLMLASSNTIHTDTRISQVHGQWTLPGSATVSCHPSPPGHFSFWAEVCSPPASRKVIITQLILPAESDTGNILPAPLSHKEAGATFWGVTVHSCLFFLWGECLTFLLFLS